MIGERIGTYQILRQLGEGGMGTVWLAEHVMIGRRAAIKMLHPHVSSQPDLTQRFFQEAKAAAAVQDAGIVQIFDFGQHSDGRAYLVMELLDGESLEQRMAKSGPVPLPAALRILEQVASSIGAVHLRGIVHRDLKPDNIYLVRDAAASGGERPKILDFGIAKIANAGVKTMTSVVMGTPMFMSPEQCRGAGSVDARSDVYSLSCMLFLMLTGRPPFFAEGVGDLISMHLREPAPAPSSLAPSIPPAVDALILRCLEKEPSRRFATANELAEALASAAARLPGASQSFGGLGEVGAARGLPHAAGPTPLPHAAPHLEPHLAPHAAPYLATPMAQTTLTATSGSRTSAPKRARAPLMGWLYAGLVAAAISMSAVAITALGDRDPAPPDSVNATLPAASLASAVRQEEAALVAAPSEPSARLPAAAAAPHPDEEPARPTAPVPPAAPAPEPPPPAAPTAPPVAPAPAPPAAPPPKPPGAATRAPLTDLGTIGGPSPRCTQAHAALDAFIKRSYQAAAPAALKEAHAIPTGCLNKSQRYRLALVAISLACKARDRASALRFFQLASDDSLRTRCPKLLR